ncbi:MAG: tetratricopeptide repeat protein, partial [Bacteroidota bacterium]
LKSEVEKHRSLHSAMEDPKVTAFNQKLQNIDNKLKRKKNNLLFWKAAASLVFLIGLAVFFLLLNNGGQNDLFKDYYTPYPIEDTIRGTNENRIDKASQSYARGEYKTAIPELNSLVSQFPDRTVLKLYLGNCYLGTDQEKEAIRVFEQIKKEDGYYENAQWYLALSYLKDNDKNKSIATLENIVSYNGALKERALALLKKLKINTLDDIEELP